MRKSQTTYTKEQRKYFILLYIFDSVENGNIFYKICIFDLERKYNFNYFKRKG